MASVYRATQLGLDRPVALKVMASEYSSDREHRDRFMRAVRILGAIDHPNVIPIHAGGQEDGRLYIVMKLVEGNDLHELLTRNGRLEPPWAIRVIEQLAGALDVAHDRGVVHRDVKPANVLVETATGQIYLTDFDLAKRLGDDTVTSSTHTFATANYAAPERFRGGRDGDTGTVSGDVYSLGMILWEVLAGLDRPKELPPGVPGVLERVIETAISLDPEDRYQSGGELARQARSAFELHKPPRKPESIKVTRSTRRGPFPEPISVGLSERVARLCEEILARLDGDGDLTDMLRQIRGELDEPVRVAVAGRVSAGKSTLVNALLGRRIAQTDLGETTRVVTWYRHVQQSGPNASERIEIHLRNGERLERSFGLDGTMPASIDEIAVEEIAVVHAWLQLDTLKSLTIIDTPGLASLTEGARARAMEVIAADTSDEQQEHAIREAQALLFVMAGDAREDDEEALRRFQARFRRSASAVNAIGILTKVDKAAAAEGTWPNAIRKAQRIRDGLGPLVAAVVPVIGLLAEAADAGGLNEDHARWLDSLARAGDIDAFGDFDSFQSIDAPVSASQRDELHGLLQAYGLTEAYKLHQVDQLTGVNLVRRMREVSGIPELRRQLEGFDQRADALKAEAALSHLDRLSWRDRRLVFVRAEVERVRQEESMQVLELFAALDRCVVDRISLPSELMADLERMVTARSVPARLGVENDTDTVMLEQRAKERQQVWNTFYVDPGTGLAAASVASPMVQAYSILVSQMQGALA